MYGSVRGVPGNRHSYRDKLTYCNLEVSIPIIGIFRSYFALSIPQMIAIFNSCGMITILPESPFPVLSLIKFLPGSACNQFDGI